MKFLKELGFTTALSIICSALIVTPTFAGRLPDSTLDFFAENNIYYYNPAGSAVNCSAAEAQNYAGASVLSKEQVQQIESLREIYKQAEEQYNVPWRVLAAIHAVENDLSLIVPEGRTTGGIYNLPGFSGGSATDTEELQRQTDALAKAIAEDYGKNLDLTDTEDIKRLFYNYDQAIRESFYGKSDDGHYAERATAMGYSNPADGSTYVMNRYDAQRDPVNTGGVDSRWKFIYDSEGNWVAGTTNIFGAYVIYEAIGGAGMCIGGVRSGGVTSLEEARKYVDEYNSAECQEYSSNCLGKIDPGGNCVSYVQYWISRYTILGDLPLHNGGSVVNWLSNNRNIPTGTAPQPYSAFSSYDTNAEFGHTGIILGVDQDRDIIYVAQMNYFQPISWGQQPEQIQMSLTGFMNLYPTATFAYLESYLSEVY